MKQKITSFIEAVGFTKRITELDAEDNLRELQDMKAKDYPIDGNEILEALNDVLEHVKGKKTLRSTTIRIPPEIAFMPPEEVERIRKKMNVSQALFAKMLNVPLVTAKSWESGTRKPSGAALRLLQLVKENPRVVYDSSKNT